MQTHSEKKKFITAIAQNGGYYSKYNHHYLEMRQSIKF